jgi:GTP-binding protein HflX
MVEQAAAAAEVLAEIGAADRPTLLAFNKVDRLPARGWVERLVEQHQPCVAISAVTGENLDELRRAMAAMLGRDRRVAAMRVPFARPDALHELRTRGEVLDEAIDGDAVRLTVRGDERLLGKWRVFAEGEGDEQ